MLKNKSKHNRTYGNSSSYRHCHISCILYLRTDVTLHFAAYSLHYTFLFSLCFLLRQYEFISATVLLLQMTVLIIRVCVCVCVCSTYLPVYKHHCLYVYKVVTVFIHGGHVNMAFVPELLFACCT